MKEKAGYGKYVPILKQVTMDNNISFKTISIETKEQAQTVPSPCTTYTTFYNGSFFVA